MKTKKTLITITTSLLALLIVTTVTYAINPTLTPSSTPGTDTQYSLNDIYNKLTDFSTTTDDGTGLFTTPPEVTAQFATLSDVYGLLEDEEIDLVPENIKDGVTIFGVEGELVEQTELEWSSAWYASSLSDATNHCANLAPTGDWRLPTMGELIKRLYDYMNYGDPQTELFGYNDYWRSSDSGYGVSYGDGTGPQYIEDSQYARHFCVR